MLHLNNTITKIKLEVKDGIIKDIIFIDHQLGDKFELKTKETLIGISHEPNKIESCLKSSAKFNNLTEIKTILETLF